MAAPTGPFYGVGARWCQALVLDANGWPAATSTTVYEGFQLHALKNFNFDWPDARKIEHYGGDKVRASDFLPPNTSGTASAALAAIDPSTFALLTSTKVHSVGEAAVVGFGTSKLGYESDVCMYAVQQEVDGSGLRRWRMSLAPVARAIIKEASMNENPSEYGVNLNLAVTDRYPWGIDFSEANNGFTTAQALSVHTKNFPWIATWKGDNVATEFNFAAGHEAAALGESFDVHGVWIYTAAAGTWAADATPTLAADGVTPTTKPASGDLVVAFYGLATAPE